MIKNKRNYITIEEQADENLLNNAIWMIANGLKRSYYDFCYIHDLEDHPVSLQMFRNQHEKTVEEITNFIFECFGLNEKD